MIMIIMMLLMISKSLMKVFDEKISEGDISEFQWKPPKYLHSKDFCQWYPILDEPIFIVMHQKEDKKKLMNAARERARAQLWSTFPLLQALSLILTLFYLPTFEGFRILLLSFALLLQFLFCVVFLNKKMKVWTISLSAPSAPIEIKIKYCLAFLEKKYSIEPIGDEKVG